MKLPITRLTRAGFMVDGASADLLAGLLDAYEFDSPGLVAVLPAFEALPLKAVSMQYRSSRLGPCEWDWNPTWVQVMGDKYGLAISCADDPDQPPLVRSVEDSAGTADWQTDYQVVSLCTPVTWWIQGMRRGWYQYDQSTHAWNRDRTDIPQQVLMYRMS